MPPAAKEIVCPPNKNIFLEVPLFLQLYIIRYIQLFFELKKCQLPSWNQKKLFFSGCKLKSQIKQLSLRGKRKLWESSLPIRLVYSCLIKSWHLFFILGTLGTAGTTTCVCRFVSVPLNSLSNLSKKSIKSSIWVFSLQALPTSKANCPQAFHWWVALQT